MRRRMLLLLLEPTCWRVLHAGRQGRVLSEQDELDFVFEVGVGLITAAAWFFYLCVQCTLVILQASY